MNKINDNKFRNFLCRIFKKKYKEIKEEDGNKCFVRRAFKSNCLDLKKSLLLLMYG